MEWKEVRLGDVYEVHNGLSKSGKYFGYGHPFLTFSDVFKNFFLPQVFGNKVDSTEKERNSYNIKRGDVFITRTSETAEELGMSSVALKDVPYATYNGFTKRLRPIDGETLVLPEFIGYHLRSKRFRNNFYVLSGGMSTRASLANGDLLNMKVQLPSLDTQRRIASILSSLDRKIELNNKINAQLEEMAQAIFKSWFVDFEPFKDGKFVESELGMIPEGWRIVSFREFLTPSTVKTGVEGITEYSVTNTGIHPRDSKFIKSLSKSSAKNKLLKKGNLVFGMSREILNWGIMKDDIGGVSSAYNIYIVNESIIPVLFLELYIQNRMGYFHDLIKPASREGQSLDKTVLLKKLAYITSIEVYQSFLEIYSPIVQEMHYLDAENLRLSQLRNTLLPKLMNGEIELPNDDYLQHCLYYKGEEECPFPAGTHAAWYWRDEAMGQDENHRRIGHSFIEKGLQFIPLPAEQVQQLPSDIQDMLAYATACACNMQPMGGDEYLKHYGKSIEELNEIDKK